MKTAILVGCGQMARGWLAALRDDAALKGRVKIVGLVDLSVAAAHELAREFDLQDVAIGSDLASVLSATNPDFVFDVVVPNARRELVTTALAAGCHVLSEKPMAASMEEAKELLAAAKKADRLHVIVQNRRFIEGVRRIKSFLQSGALGEVSSVNCDFFIGAHFGGFREDMDHVLLLDMAIHTFDAARFMSGALPQTVYCHESNPQSSWYRTGANATAIFDFGNGVTFNYRGSWCAEGANTSWEGEWRIVGSKGTLLWDGAESFSAKIVSGEEGFFRPLEEIEVPQAPDASLLNGHASVIATFLDAIETGTPPETDSSDNINSLAMVFGAIQSVKTGERVNIQTQILGD